ncbi:MAG TPA: translocation/assembly module TamB domain-containing protein [Deltaproteobacteria bacterium]|nr:translocation/assembly module TamB domain-containing protein [Deltaproteobacteria bacterium]HOI06124.1 translocation/assembly module TamB domain-containing protein [Deltaproteobacteria bacterium]
MKILAGTLLVLLCLAVLGVVGLHVFLSTPPGERFALDLVNSGIPGRIAFSNASISLLGESLQIENGVLEGPDGSRILRVDSLRVRIDLLSLLNKRISLTSVSARGPQLHLARSKDGRLNIVEALVKEEEEPEEEGFEVVLEGFRAEGGEVLYTDEAGDLKARLAGVGLAGSFDFERTAGWASASAGEVALDYGGPPVVLQQVAVKARLDGELLAPLRIEARRGRFRVAAEGSVKELFTDPVLDIAVDASGEIADLVSLLGPGMPFSGSASGAFTVRGVPGNPEVSSRIAYSGGDIAGVKVEKLDLKARLSDRVVVVEDARAALASGRASLTGRADLREVFPEGFLGGKINPRALAYSASASASGIDLNGLFPDQGGLPANVSGQVEMSGSGFEPPDLSGKATYAFRVSGIPGGLPVSGRRIDVTGRAGLAYPVLKLESSASMGTMRAQGSGRVDLESGLVRADVDLHTPRIEELAAGTGVPARGALDVRAAVSGPIGRPRIGASVLGRDLRFRDYLVGDARMEAVLDSSGVLVVDRLTVTNGGHAVDAGGRVRLFRDGFSLDPDMSMAMEAAIRSENLQALARAEGLKGLLEGRVSLQGSLFNPTGSFDISGRGLSFRDVTVGDMELHGGLSQGIVDVPDITLSNDGSLVKASARAHLLDVRRRRIQPDPRVELSLTGDIRDLGSFTPLARGGATVRADLSGTVGSPDGTVSVQGTGLTISGQKIEEASLNSTLAGRKVEAEGRILIQQGQSITGTGSLGLEGSRPYTVLLKSEGVNLSAFPVLRKYGITGGSLVIDVAGKGILARPQLEGNVLVTGLTVNYEPHRDVFVHLRMNGSRVTMLGESDFGFSGDFDLASRDLSMQAIFKETELETYFRIAGRPELNGVLTGEAALEGNARDLRDVDLDLRIASVDISIRQDRILRGANLSAGYHDRRLSIPRSRVALLEQGSMMVQADTDRDGNLDLSASGLIPLEIAPLFFPDLEDIMGTLRFDLAVRGPVTSPAVTGDLYLDDVQYLISYNNALVHSVNGRIELAGDRAVFRELTGRLDTGYFTVRGMVGLKDLDPVSIDLDLSARSLPVEVPDTMDLLLEVNASVTGTPDSSLLTGKAVILEGTYYRDQQLDIVAEVGERITGLGRRPKAPGKPIDLPFLREMELEVAVSRRGSVTIDNNLATATINPDLLITGTLNDPVVTGRVSVIQGTVTYQKRSFDIVRGVVDFSNPYRTEARVDVSAQGKIREWTITLAAQGPLDNLNISLTSIPPADNATILSLLATGRTPDELTGGTGVSTRDPTSMLAEVLADTYGEKVRQTTGIDILEVETGALVQPGAQAQDIRITVGEKLTRRLTLKYSVETSSSEVTRTTTAEYQLLEYILLNGFQESTGSFGGNIQFRLEFR